MLTSGGPRNSAPGTLNRIFLDAVSTYHKPDALQVKRNGRYEPISHDTLAERVRRTALGLEELGVKAGDRFAILSENRPEWAIADFACLMSGVTDVPIYPNLPSDQVAYILRDSGAVGIFVSNAEQAAKIAEVRSTCPALRHVGHDGRSEGRDADARQHLLERGRRTDADSIRRRRYVPQLLAAVAHLRA